MTRTLRNATLALALSLAGCMGESTAQWTPQQLPPEVAPPNPADPTITPPVAESGRAVLELSLAPMSPVVSVGQRFVVEVQVRNVGRATASGVAPSTPAQLGAGRARLVEAPTPGITDLPAGDARLFRFLYEAQDPGGVSFEVTADGMDIDHDQAVAAQPQVAQLIIESGALLQVDRVDAPLQATLGAEVVVRADVSNGGQATALQVRPQLSMMGTGGGLVLVAPAAAVDLPGGQSGSFEWRVRTTQAGPLRFAVAVEGLDANSRLPVLGQAAAAFPLDVERPAALEVEASLPQAVSSGQTLLATLTVRNPGSATAKAVALLAGSPSFSTLSGDAAATVVSAPTLPLDVPGGGEVTLRWELAVTGTGSLTFSAGVGGSDGNTQGPIASAVVTSSPAQVLAPTALVVSQVQVPAAVARGQAFSVTVVVRNNGGTAATGVLPTPSPLQVAATGLAQVTLSTSPGAQDVAAGAQASFTFGYREAGTGTGSLAFSAGARGANASSGAQVTAPAVQSASVQVLNPPSLVVESVVAPARVSRGQGFEVQVAVRNAGGAEVRNVRPQVTLQASGGATAAAGVAPASVALAAGARTTFRVPYVAGTGSSGSLTPSATAAGDDPLSGQALASAAVAGSAVAVQAPARLALSSFTMPASLPRGTGFALSLRVTNAGEATATGVVAVPAPPTATVTGGVVVSTTTVSAPVSIAGGQSATFTWLYTELGSAPGTVAFNAGARGLDANTGLEVQLASATSNSASVETPVGCNGSALYTGFGGASLDGDRLDLGPGTNRLRVKPYAMLPGEFGRVLGTTPARIQNQGATFEAPGTRWASEQQLSAVSLYQAYLAAFQGCLTYTGSATAYAANPTATTATTECTNFQRRFWSRVPTAAETQACAGFATAALNDDTNPRRRWAYVCASVLVSAGFLAN